MTWPLTTRQLTVHFVGSPPSRRRQGVRRATSLCSRHQRGLRCLHHLVGTLVLWRAGWGVATDGMRRATTISGVWIPSRWTPSKGTLSLVTHDDGPRHSALGTRRQGGRARGARRRCRALRGRWRLLRMGPEMLQWRLRHRLLRDGAAGGHSFLFDEGGRGGSGSGSGVRVGLRL